MDSNIDANELFNNNQELLKVLLFDNTTKKNIIWATENYSNKGVEYMSSKPILPNLLKTKTKLLKPRIEKSKAEQVRRSKDNAEVFTPCWIVNKQNNLADNAWFGKDNLFNTENDDGSWISTEKVLFEGTGKTWQEYVSDVRLKKLSFREIIEGNGFRNISINTRVSTNRHQQGCGEEKPKIEESKLSFHSFEEK